MKWPCRLTRTQRYFLQCLRFFFFLATTACVPAALKLGESFASPAAGVSRASARKATARRTATRRVAEGRGTTARQATSVMGFASSAWQLLDLTQGCYRRGLRAGFWGGGLLSLRPIAPPGAPSR